MSQPQEGYFSHMQSAKESNQDSRAAQWGDKTTSDIGSIMLWFGHPYIHAYTGKTNGFISIQVGRKERVVGKGTWHLLVMF